MAWIQCHVSPFLALFVRFCLQTLPASANRNVQRELSRSCICNRMFAVAIKINVRRANPSPLRARSLTAFATNQLSPALPARRITLLIRTRCHSARANVIAPLQRTPIHAHPPTALICVLGINFAFNAICMLAARLVIDHFTSCLTKSL